jgi:hypothetical protein
MRLTLAVVRAPDGAVRAAVCTESDRLTALLGAEPRSVKAPLKGEDELVLSARLH